jgi:hypothetical protein
MSMTIPAPETNPEEIKAPVSPYFGLPKPPMAPPSRATERIPLIMAPSVSFPPQMSSYLI